MIYKSLLDCADFLSGGTPSKSNISFWSGDLPWVSSGEMTQPRITDTVLHITNEAGKLYSKVVPKKTILVVVRGMSLANEFRVSITQREMAFNQDIKALIPKEGVNPLFLFYSLYGRRFEISKLASESAHGTKKLDTKVLESIPILLPELPFQERIAAILSAYDDLIENNDRRIALLEKTAEEIYREWFVRLRFPEYEKSITCQGFPEDWETVKLGSVVELAYGKALKEEDRISGNYPVFGSSGVVGSNNRYLVKAPGIIIGRKGNVGSVHWSDQDFYPIDTVYYVKSKLDFHFLFFLLKSLNFINNDAAVPGLNRGQAYANEFYLPPQPLIEKYAKTVKCFFDCKSNLEKQEKVLKQTRDRLLTRLISGKLSVEDLDIQFPPSMATDA